MSRFVLSLAMFVAMTTSTFAGEVLYHTAPYGNVPAIGVGDTRQGVLEESDRSEAVDGSRYDDWGIKLARGQCIEATMTTPGGGGGALDPFLVIGRFDKKKQLIDQMRDDDGAGGRNARARLCAPKEDVYFIRANAYNAGSYGAYTLEVKPYKDRPPGVPAMLPVGTMVYGSLDAKTDERLRARGLDSGEELVDRYQFEATPNSWYVVDLRSENFDSVLEAFTAPAGAYEPLTFLAHDNDSGGSNNARLYFETPANASIIHLRASGLKRGDAGAYTIAVARRLTDAGAKPRIATLKPGRDVDGKLTLSDPQRGKNRLYDRYKFEGRKGQTYEIELRTNQFDALLEVFADTAVGPRLVEQNDDGSPYVTTCTPPPPTSELLWRGCLNSRVTITFRKSGWVYLDVTSPNLMTTGDYTLLLNKGYKTP